MNKKIYMSGIGGISMSGIAEILENYGYFVSGSDITMSDTVKHLIEKGINVNIGQVKENITEDYDLFVYTAAISPDNEELLRAKELGIKTMERGKFLGELTKKFKDTIGVAGTHGKTTTSSMVTCVFIKAKKDPTVQIGAYLKNIGGNFVVGKSDYFIIESCEYKDSFQNFALRSTIVTNIDNDHLDYFKTIDNISASFKKYVSKLPKDGLLVVNMDDNRCYELKDFTNAAILTTSISNNRANFYAENIEFDDIGCPSFDVFYNGEKVIKVKLNVKGEHNISNALECFALCYWYGIDPTIIASGLLEFTGSSRRMEYKGDFMGAKVYDDYAHHPTEILATSKAIVKEKYNETYAIFEPHTYSRVLAHKKEFAESLRLFDHIIVTDIYAAREQNTYGVSSLDIINELLEIKKDAIYLKDYEEIKDYLSTKIKQNDIIITLGAGNVTKIANNLIKETNN